MILHQRTEHEIIGRCLNGEKEEYALLVQRYQGMVYTTAYRMLGDEQGAKDAAQESFIAAYVSLKSFRRDAKFSSWLMSITLNKCRDILRGRKDTIPVLEMENTLRSRLDDPEVRFRNKEEEGALQNALNRLPEEYREAIIMKHIQELDYAEMSALTGMSAGALKVRAHRAREMLKELLLKGGVNRGTG